jgi:hypothetical protein
MDPEKIAKENGWDEWKIYVLNSLEELKTGQKELAALLRNELYGEGKDCPGLKQKVNELYSWRESYLKWRWLLLSAILSGIVSLAVAVVKALI